MKLKVVFVASCFKLIFYYDEILVSDCLYSPIFFILNKRGLKLGCTIILLLFWALTLFLKKILVSIYCIPSCVNFNVMN
jgi:hypothetical protein